MNATLSAAQDAAPALHCRGVTKTYHTVGGAVYALRGVDIDVHRGELLMLVGPSGCGKTTLISIMAGILDQDAGECTVYGEDLRALPPGRRTRVRGKTIGFVFQAFNLLPALTAAENVAVPLIINGRPRREAVREASRLLERVGLGGRLSALPSELSGGQQQRVAIARALVHDPRLVVCDEPTSSLDHDTGRQIMQLLRELAADGHRALVVVSHDQRIYDFADRIARMDDGRIVGVERPPAAAAAPGDHP
jgi:putative ABC transport system ATP-binding protein